MLSRLEDGFGNNSTSSGRRQLSPTTKNLLRHVYAVAATRVIESRGTNTDISSVSVEIDVAGMMASDVSSVLAVVGFVKSGGVSGIVMWRHSSQSSSNSESSQSSQSTSWEDELLSGLIDIDDVVEVIGVVVEFVSIVVEAVGVVVVVNLSGGVSGVVDAIISEHVPQ